MGEWNQEEAGVTDMKYNLPERVVNDITVFAHRHDVQKVVLFGSRARGTHTEKSDIDLAVSGGDFDAFYWDIKENAHSLLSFDIVDSMGVSADLKEEIEKDGITVYEKT